MYFPSVFWANKKDQTVERKRGELFAVEMAGEVLRLRGR